MKCHLLALIGLGALAVPALAQDPTQGKDQKKDQKKEEDVVKREEVVVVSASKVESTLINAPATMSVIDADTLVTSPAQNYGDLLRSVPGLNVIQMSARDINVTARQATSTLTDSQLVLLDGRSIYLDFFGLVLWDFLPQSPNEIKQIEVVRGPASAVWGANALTGVINIITKSPREAQGLAVNVTGGLINRDAGSRQGQGNGYSGGANFSYSQAPSDKLAWRLSAGYFYSDPYSRTRRTRVPCPASPARRPAAWAAGSIPPTPTVWARTSTGARASPRPTCAWTRSLAAAAT
jgi:outer membrane receptor protein involved in Fe transport